MKQLNKLSAAKLMLASSTTRQQPWGPDTKSHHLLEIRNPPTVMKVFREELAKHTDIYAKAQKGKDFGECLGIVAAELSIALDGEYDVIPLLEILVKALRNRNITGLSAHMIDSSLVQVELVERKNAITLEEIGERSGETDRGEAGEGPYTTCDSCLTTFDCCNSRSCKLNTPVAQLGNTMKLLKETMQ